MVRSSKPSLLPAFIWLALFFVGLIAAHMYVDSVLGRQIADISLLIAFFGGLLLWSGRR